MKKKQNDTKILFTFERRTRCEIFDLNIYRCYKHFFLPFPKRCRVVLLLLVKMFVHRIHFSCASHSAIHFKNLLTNIQTKPFAFGNHFACKQQRKGGKKTTSKNDSIWLGVLSKMGFLRSKDIYIFFSIFESSQLWYRLWFRVILILSIVEFDAMRQIHWVENSCVSFHFDWHWLRRT